MTYKPTTRRDFLAATGAAMLASATRATSAQSTAELPYIDAHCHIWTRDFAKYPLVKEIKPEDLKPASFTAEELIAVTEKHGVGRVVLIAHSQFYLWDNSYLLDATRAYPQRFRVVGMVDNLAPHAGRKMKELLPQKVTGFRITPRVHGDKWLTGGMDEMWQTGAETGQALCFLIMPEHLPQVAGLCERFPQTPVVIDHFARVGADGELRDKDIASLCELAKHKKTYVKLSAYYALGRKKPPYTELIPMIRRVLDAFGPERLMWASDAPYQINDENTYAASLALIRDKLDFVSDGDRAWLLTKTAEKVFFAG